MKVLIIEDDPQIADAIATGFELSWQDCATVHASDGEEGLRRFALDEPDVVILDVGLPGQSGFDVLREIRQQSDVPVVMLTARADEMQQVRGLELGADDYVAKPFSQLALQARVKSILRRADLPAPLGTQPDFVAGDLVMHYEAQQVTLRGAPVQLTPVEYRLLYQLARNAGRLLPHQLLLDRVWGPDYGATADYLKVFMSRLRGKLETDPAQRPFIENVRGRGYRFVLPKEPTG